MSDHHFWLTDAQFARLQPLLPNKPIRTIGIARARAKIGLANLAFNMKRLVFWEGRTAAA